MDPFRERWAGLVGLSVRTRQRRWPQRGLEFSTRYSSTYSQITNQARHCGSVHCTLRIQNRSLAYSYGAITRQRPASHRSAISEKRSWPHTRTAGLPHETSAYLIPPIFCTHPAYSTVPIKQPIEPPSPTPTHQLQKWLTRIPSRPPGSRSTRVSSSSSRTSTAYPTPPATTTTTSPSSPMTPSLSSPERRTTGARVCSTAVQTCYLIPQA